MQRFHCFVERLFSCTVKFLTRSLRFLTCSSKKKIGPEIPFSLLHALSTLHCFQGRQFPDANLPGIAPEERKAIFEVSMKTLAQLQSLETDKLQLDCIGNKENFFHQRVGALIHTTEIPNAKHPSNIFLSGLCLPHGHSLCN